MNNPAVLGVGDRYNVKFSLKDVLTPQRKDFLRRGGVILIGRKPQSKTAKIPEEVARRSCDIYQIPNADSYVSKIQGFLTLNQNGQLIYKDCSSNGSFVEKSTAVRNKAHVDEKECGYGSYLGNGDIVAIDERSPSILMVGTDSRIPFDTAKVLNGDLLKHLDNDGIILIGRAPSTTTNLIPDVDKHKKMHLLKIPGSDAAVSKTQGYFFKNQKGQICYRDVSTNGTFIRPNNAFESRKMQNVVGGRN